MNLKFNLEKFAKIRDYQNLPVNYSNTLWEKYTKYLEENKGKDVDFPDSELSFE